MPRTSAPVPPSSQRHRAPCGVAAGPDVRPVGGRGRARPERPRALRPRGRAGPRVSVRWPLRARDAVRRLVRVGPRTLQWALCPAAGQAPSGRACAGALAMVPEGLLVSGAGGPPGMWTRATSPDDFYVYDVRRRVWRQYPGAGAWAGAGPAVDRCAMTTFPDPDPAGAAGRCYATHGQVVLERLPPLSASRNAWQPRGAYDFAASLDCAPFAAGGDLIGALSRDHNDLLLIHWPTARRWVVPRFCNTAPARSYVRLDRDHRRLLTLYLNGAPVLRLPGLSVRRPTEAFQIRKRRLQRLDRWRLHDNPADGAVSPVMWGPGPSHAVSDVYEFSDGDDEASDSEPDSEFCSDAMDLGYDAVLPDAGQEAFMSVQDVVQDVYRRMDLGYDSDDYDTYGLNNFGDDYDDYDTFGGYDDHDYDDYGYY